MTGTGGIFWSFWGNCRSGLELDCTGGFSWTTIFHLLLETPEANLSQTGQWLNVAVCGLIDGTSGAGTSFRGGLARCWWVATASGWKWLGMSI
jgi:hypothetical protein